MLTTDIDAATLGAQGYLLLPAFLTHDELATLRTAVEELCAPLPEPGEAPPQSQFAHFHRAPFGVDALDDLAFHPLYAARARAILGTDDVRLTKANVWLKIGGTADYDQPLHRDYPDQDLLVPVDPDAPDQVAFLTYFDDVDATNGPTAVVPRSVAPAVPPEIAELDRTDGAELYAREITIRARAGEMLAMPVDTWHRATNLREKGSRRTIFTVGFRRADAEWCGSQSWPTYGKGEALRSLVSRLDNDQRALLGFPSPSWPGWTPARRNAVERRYSSSEKGR